MEYCVNVGVRHQDILFESEYDPMVSVYPVHSTYYSDVSANLTDVKVI